VNATRPSVPRAGEILAGRFRLSALLHRGWRALVFEAVDEDLGETVAVKVVLDGLDSARRELLVSRSFSHPNVCRIHELHVHGGLPFLVMELLQPIGADLLIDRRGRLKIAPRHAAVLGSDAMRVGGPTKLEPILEELELAASKMGVKVSYEPLAETVGGGGLCKVKGTYRVIIEKRATIGEKVATLAKSLATVGTEQIFLSPSAREIVDRYLPTAA
jgi:hypothetical protein